VVAGSCQRYAARNMLSN